MAVNFLSFVGGRYASPSRSSACISQPLASGFLTSAWRLRLGIPLCGQIMPVSLQVYADVVPLLERVSQAQRQALFALTIGWHGGDLQRLTDAALRKTLSGLVESVFPGSDKFRLSSSLHRQIYQVRTYFHLPASVVRLGSQLQVPDSSMADAAPAVTG